jgi:hypothetical protein
VVAWWSHGEQGVQGRARRASQFQAFSRIYWSVAIVSTTKTVELVLHTQMHGAPAACSSSTLWHRSVAASYDVHRSPLTGQAELASYISSTVRRVAHVQSSGTTGSAVLPFHGTVSGENDKQAGGAGRRVIVRDVLAALQRRKGPLSSSNNNNNNNN